MTTPINIDRLLEVPSSLTNGRTYEQVLIDARGLLSDHSRWTQGAYARSLDGFNVRPRSPYACCWCMLGAIAYCSNAFGIIPPPLMYFIEDMMKYKFGEKFLGPGAMNDYVSYEDMLAFLDEAIAQFNR